MKGPIGVDSKTKLIHSAVVTPANVHDSERMTNRRKSSVRAKVEHAFGVIKRISGFAKVCYRGMMKNANRFFVACALANLFMVRRDLMRLHGA